VTDLPFPLSGSTLIVGPSGAGKTTLTAGALEAWLEREGPAGTVVFDFGPAIERDGRIVGARLDRYTRIPDAVWTGIVDAHAPRSEGSTEKETLALARENAERANQLFEAAPSDPRAVFVNDATIAFQHERGDLDGFLDYCAGADCVTINAFEGREFGTEDPVSRRERAVLERLREWADRTVELD
jgi:hypothetical protein